MKKEFPIVSLKNIYHVGTMDINNKQEDSHEGRGLSFSTEPNAWRRITRLVGNTQYSLIKNDNKFLNFHHLKKVQTDIILAFGVKKGYTLPAQLYKITYFDDEMDCDLQCFYTSLEEALEESENYEVEPEAFEGYISTEKMKKRVMGDAEPMIILDLLSTIYAEDVLDIDGVWWSDKLDVYNYSAPRGVISQSKLKEWEIKIANN